VLLFHASNLNDNVQIESISKNDAKKKVIKDNIFFFCLPSLGFLLGIGVALALGVSATLEIKQRETPRTFVSAV
jgi:adenine/guanine phosphoribosyltransferase-like PRPP-binding protein